MQGAVGVTVPDISLGPVDRELGAEPIQESGVLAKCHRMFQRLGAGSLFSQAVYQAFQAGAHPFGKQGLRHLIPVGQDVTGQ